MISFQFFAGLTRLFVCKELWRQVLHEIQECASFWLKFLNFLCESFSESNFSESNWQFVSMGSGFICDYCLPVVKRSWPRGQGVRLRILRVRVCTFACFQFAQIGLTLSKTVLEVQRASKPYLFFFEILKLKFKKK